ncbi:hypothetical protein GAGA_2802 [Paraglaciecola agarilytica NO2]|uniref:Uncharacterized protein n=1 Tax=Paraglaciecola agarilytica NO2 TaxID=1125747 RepID=A0ABQ0I8D1_9ALTE|nr:hypothetical protein GAGA_2802 [Paraglaciecola agarilytica NO2]
MMPSIFYQDTHDKDAALLIKILPSTDGFPLTWAGGNSYNQPCTTYSEFSIKSF